jgi:hypothetical protein
MYTIADAWQTPEYYYCLIDNAYEKYCAVLQWLSYGTNRIEYINEYLSHILNRLLPIRRRRGIQWRELGTS